MAVTKRTSGGSASANTAAPAANKGAASSAAAARSTNAEVDNRSRRACLHTQLKKTKICMYHLRGCCQYGEECAFAHTCTELRSTPDLSKTRLCKAILAGAECHDPECQFAHTEEELRSTNLFFKKTLCIWNEKGKCRNGDQCRFAHGSDELRGAMNAGKAVPEIPQAQQGSNGKQKVEKGANAKRNANNNGAGKAPVGASAPRHLGVVPELQQQQQQQRKPGAQPQQQQQLQQQQFIQQQEPPLMEPMKVPFMSQYGQQLPLSNMAEADDVATTLVKLQEKITALSQRCTRMGGQTVGYKDELGRPVTPPGLDSPGSTSYGANTPASTYSRSAAGQFTPHGSIMGRSISEGSNQDLGNMVFPQWPELLQNAELLAAAGATPPLSNFATEDSAAAIPYLANLVAISTQAQQRAQQQMLMLAKQARQAQMEQLPANVRAGHDAALLEQRLRNL